jgi:hypothetical protein
MDGWVSICSLCRMAQEEGSISKRRRENERQSKYIEETK